MFYEQNIKLCVVNCILKPSIKPHDAHFFGKIFAKSITFHFYMSQKVVKTKCY